MNVFCVHSPTLCVGAILIVFTYYIKLFTFAIQPGYHGASWLCLLILFVCHRILCDTWSHSSSSHESWEQKNKTTMKKNNRNTSSFKKFYPKSLFLLKHKSSSLTLFYCQALVRSPKSQSQDQKDLGLTLLNARSSKFLDLGQVLNFLSGDGF